MSERMKQGGRRQGMTPAALWQHQRRGREALQLEIAGEYDAAARAWQHTANRAPHPQWRMRRPGKGASLPGKVVFSSGRLLTVHITARRAGYPAPCGGGDQHESDRKTAGVKPV